MKILGTATALATGTTKFTDATMVYVFNTDTSAGVLTLRNKDDDANVGTVYIGAGSGIEVSLELGQGLRGPATLFGTQVSSTGY
jgi:uncharacterized protein YpmB